MPCSISLDSGNEQEIIIESSKNKGPTKNDISLRYTRPVLLIRNGFHMFPCRNQNIGFKSRFPDSEWQFSHMHALDNWIAFSHPFLVLFMFWRRKNPDFTYHENTHLPPPRIETLTRIVHRRDTTQYKKASLRFANVFNITWWRHQMEAFSSLLAIIIKSQWPIGHPLGLDLGDFLEFDFWPKFYLLWVVGLLCALSCYTVPRYIESR